MQRVRCPKCDKNLNILDTNSGKAVRCSACGAKFTPDKAEEGEWLDDLAHAAAMKNVAKSATYETEAEERRRTSEQVKSARQTRAKILKVVDLIGLCVLGAMVLLSALLLLTSFVAGIATGLALLVGFLAILLGFIMCFLLLYLEGVAFSIPGESVFGMRRYSPVIFFHLTMSLIQYTIEMPRRFGPWLAIQVCGIGLILASLFITALLKPPPYPGWKPPSNPGAVTANNRLAPAGKDRTGPKKSEPPKVTGDATLDQALVDLEKGDSGVCLTAANKLVKIPPVPEHRALIAQKLAARVTDPNVFTRLAIIKALGVWGTTNEVPALIDTLNGTDRELRSQTLQIIGKFRDERTLGPVSRCFADGVTRNDACKAFRDMGSMAEKEVLPYLKSDNVFMRLDVVNILKDIGTEASVPALQAILAGDNAFTNKAAKDALAAIANRK